METTTVEEKGGENPAFAAVRGMIKEKGLRFAEFWFTDLTGKPWRISMAAEALDERIFTVGLPLDGQPVGGAWDGVMLLVPRYDALYVDPTAALPTLAMFCDVLDPATNEPLELEPRHVLKRAVRFVDDRLGASLSIGAEPEFVLLDAKGAPASEGEVWEFLGILADALGKAGVQVDWFRYGPGPGQGRVQMRADAALQLADRVLLYRHLARNLARARGKRASFLPLASAGGATPGFPVHLALWKDGRNLFHNEGGWALTSAVARGCAGGLLAHLPALCALVAPTTNSYRRLVAGHRGPASPLLSVRDRGAACRIPARSTAPGARRVKFCVPDSTCNPYLAFAAILMAAVDGVEKMMEPPVDGETPARGGAPHGLAAALDALGADRAFLTAGETFSPALLDAWTRDRWTTQVLPERAAPHPAETAEDPKEA